MRRRHKLEVSTFPFLAVLLCAMGALILLLLIMDRRAKVAARAKAREVHLAMLAKLGGDAKRRADEAEQAWESQKQKLHEVLRKEDESIRLRKQQLDNAFAQIDRDLKSGKTKLIDLERRLAEEQRRLLLDRDDLERFRKQVQTASAAKTQTTSDEAIRLARDFQQLERLWAEMKQLRAQPRDVFSLVPFKGKRGEKRAPVYVECVQDALAVHPQKTILPIGANFDVARFRREVETRSSTLVKDKKNASALDKPHVLFLVRPNGVASYHAAQSALSGFQIDFGYELVDAEWVFDFDPNAQPTPVAWNQPPQLKIEPAIVKAGTRTGVGISLSVPRSQGPYSGEPGDGPPGINGGNGPSGSASGGYGPAGTGGSGTGTGGGGSTIAGLGSPSSGLPGSGPPASGQSGSGSPGSGSPGSGPSSGSTLPGSGIASATGPGGVGGQRLGSPVGTGPGSSGTGQGPPGLSQPTFQGGGSGLPDGRYPGFGRPQVAGGGSSLPSSSGGTSGEPGNGNSGGPVGIAAPGSVAPPPGASSGGVGLAQRSSVPPLSTGNGPAASNPSPLAGGPSLGPPGSGGNGGTVGETAGSSGTGAASIEGSGQPQVGPSFKVPGQISKPNGSPDAPSGDPPPEGAVVAGNSGSPPSRGVERPGEPEPLGFQLPANMPRPKEPQQQPQVVKKPPPPLGRLIANRDFPVTVQCHADHVEVIPGGYEFDMTDRNADQVDQDLLKSVRKMIERRQAVVRPGETPYRVHIRFQVHPEGLRTYLRTYPLMEQLNLPMSRENLEQ